jgi:hypothetical protein
MQRADSTPHTLCEIPIGIDTTKAARNRLYGRDRDAIAYGTVGDLNEVKVFRTDNFSMAATTRDG